MSYTASWRSPSNIALIKYWGKYDLQLPRNPSLSFTLTISLTEMTVSVSPETKFSLDVLFDGNPKPEFAGKINSFFSKIESTYPWLKTSSIRIDSTNTFPHGAGIASSASAMSALALCLQDIDDQMHDRHDKNPAWWLHVSEIARLGSGSASRSIFPVAALWGKVTGTEIGNNAFAIPWENNIAPVYASFEDSILIVNANEKSVSSTAGHAMMDSHRYAATRYNMAQEHVLQLIHAMQHEDAIDQFISIVESEALQLHALMMSGINPFILLEADTISVIKAIWNFRKETKIPVCFTLDAGPNIHLLYPLSYKTSILSWINSDLKKYCANGQILYDRVGTGPEKFG